MAEAEGLGRRLLRRARPAFTRTRLLIGLVAFLAYAPGFWWGAPHATAADRTNAWGVDDEPPLGPLAQAHDMLYPKPDSIQNFGYPMMHPYMVLSAYAPYVGWLAVSGGLSAASTGYPHGFTDPVTSLRRLSLIAHFLSVLLGVGIILAAYETGRVLWGESSGIAAALATLLIHPLFYYARNSNVDVPMMFFIACGLAAFAHVLVHGLSWKRIIWFGIFAGCAVGTKEQAFAAFVFVPPVLLVLREPGASVSPWRTARFWKLALGGVAVAFVAYALTSGMVLDFDRWQKHMAFGQVRLAEAVGGAVPWITVHPSTWAGQLALSRTLTSLLADSLSWPGLLLGVAGVAVAVRRSPRQALLALSVVGYLAVIFLTTRFGQLRYLLPPALVLAVFAGHGTVIAWRQRRSVIHAALLVVAGSTAVLTTAWGLDLTYAMIRDSRYDAGRWIEQTAREGDVLEYFGSEHKHPPMPAWLRSRHVVPSLGSMVRPDTSAAGVARVVENLAARRPRFVVLVPDYTAPAGTPHSASCPPAVFRMLESGALGYTLAKKFETPPLISWIRRPPLDYPVVNPPIRIYERTGP